MGQSFLLLTYLSTDFAKLIRLDLCHLIEPQVMNLAEVSIGWP